MSTTNEVATSILKDMGGQNTPNAAGIVTLLPVILQVIQTLLPMIGQCFSTPVQQAKVMNHPNLHPAYKLQLRRVINQIAPSTMPRAVMQASFLNVGRNITAAQVEVMQKELAA